LNQLDYDIGENKVDLLCVERNGLRKPVSAASGFQMAIIAICFRLTLTSILTNTAEFIILDEPLQCVHSSNVGKIQEMLALMPSLYKFVFIISHTEALTDTIEVPIKIQVMRDGSSFIGENSPENNAIEGVLKQTNACGSNDQVEQADQTERVEQADHIHCHVCNKTVKKKSYQQHLKSAAHLKKQPNI
jgi:ABC-type uncharacterized transport system ATPase subunit